MIEGQLCYGRSGKKIRIIAAYCSACADTFETFGIHSHEYEDGRIIERDIPCEVDVNCYRISAPAICPTCGAEEILTATEPVQ